MTPATILSSPYRKLRSAWRRELAFVQLRGLCKLVLCVLCTFLAAFLLDWSFELPGWARILMAAVVAVTLLGVLHRTWWRHIRRFDALRTALRVEGLYPQLRSILVSHVQLSAKESDLAGASPRLIEAMHAQAHELTRPLDFRAIVRLRDLRPLALGVGLTLAGALGSVALTPDLYAVFVRRMLDPSSELAYPTQTHIEATSGDLIVQQGATAVLDAWVGGVVPDEGRVDLRQNGGAWESLRVLRSEGAGRLAKFSLETAELYRSFSYRFEIGDARSPERQVLVVPSPRITSRAVTLRYPAYSGLDERSLDSLNVSTLAGTEVTWELGFDMDLEALEIVEEGMAPLRAEGDGRTFRFERTVTAPFEYELRWSDRDHGFEWEGGVRYSVRVESDMPPRVELLEPKEDQVGTLEKVVEIEFSAVDDYGLGEAWLVYGRDEEELGRERLAILSGTSLPEPFGARWKPRASIPSLTEGDSLWLAVEVSDNRLLSTANGEVPANTTRSRPRRLKVLSVADYLKYLAERKSQLFSNVGGILREETDGSESIKELKELTP